MALSTDGSWLPGIGDPTVGGWLTVAAYLAAAWSCWRLVSPAGLQRQPMPAADRRFWWLLAAAMLFFGINKQLDLQTAVTEIGRAVAKSGGWYEQRHRVQIAFIAVVAALGAAGLGALLWVSRPLTRGRALALGGLCFLGSFIVIRAASFHHVDLLIHDDFFGLRWNWIIELSAIGMLAAGAWLTSHDGTATGAARPNGKPAAARTVRAAFTPYRGPNGSGRPTAPAPHASAATASATPTTPPSSPRRAPAQQRTRAHGGDDPPVRSPGDPRNR